MITQDRLDQARIDKTIAMDRADKEIARLEQEIKEAEVTYSIGDRFKDEHGDKFIIAAVSGLDGAGIFNSIRFVSLKTGHSSGVRVENNARITSRELTLFFGEHVRYWDNRKQVQV